MVFQVQGSGTMKRFLLLLLWSILLPELSSAQDMFKLPPLPLPEDYGSVLMDKEASKKNVGPVVFSHLIHRVKYTCRVCHYELEFSMKANDTSIQCDNGKMHGRYCATCHNGKISFAPEDKDEKNCSSCHGESSSASWKTSRELQEKLPKTGFGDGIDWSKALDEGYIKPKDSLSDSTREMVNIKTITLKAEMSGISSAVFPHKTHEQWLDCSSCHPELFNIKKKTTRSLRMNNMVKGESCGICHLRVAFPLHDCKRCHPSMRR
jgi:c(7)-type cytochrome triheme protein